MNFTTQEIVEYLDEYIIGQFQAKKIIAIALRNRHRRMQLDEDMRNDIIPKNILMIGSTGVGKTEIARRLAKIMGLPFVKVEATKYTEIGYRGRDVESIVKYLASASLELVRKEYIEKNISAIEDYVYGKILEKLLPPLPKGASKDKQESYKVSYERMKEKLIAGDLNDSIIEIEVRQNFNISENSANNDPAIAELRESFMQLMNQGNTVKKEMSVEEAIGALGWEATETLLDENKIKQEALNRAANDGIIFIDEIDKIAAANLRDGQDPGREGVQRDLLPIVEGSAVTTKIGTLNTNHILFIAAGAFNLSKPSDLIPEFQGRFPLRVELDPLDENAMYKILTRPKNSLLRQYEALLKTEGVDLVFEDDAIRAIAKIAHETNEKMEDIGARRLHTVVEKIIEDISFDAHKYKDQTLHIDAKLVHDKLDTIVEDEDSARYIL